jgi:hypothetical protein
MGAIRKTVLLVYLVLGAGPRSKVSKFATTCRYNLSSTVGVLQRVRWSVSSITSPRLLSAWKHSCALPISLVSMVDEITAISADRLVLFVAGQQIPPLPPVLPLTALEEELENDDHRKTLMETSHRDAKFDSFSRRLRVLESELEQARQREQQLERVIEQVQQLVQVSNGERWQRELQLERVCEEVQQLERYSIPTLLIHLGDGMKILFQFIFGLCVLSLLFGCQAWLSGGFEKK